MKEKATKIRAMDSLMDSLMNIEVEKLRKTEIIGKTGLFPNQKVTEKSKETEKTFYYFAYGSCMCPVDLKRTFGENVYSYVVGTATLKNYRLGFYRRSLRRKCGALDVVPDGGAFVEGVLYKLPWKFSDRLDIREEVPRKGYRQEFVNVESNGKIYANVRTYVVINKLKEEIAPNDWYFQVVMRGAITCGLSEEYCWQLFNHMKQLQQKEQLEKKFKLSFGYNYDK